MEIQIQFKCSKAENHGYRATSEQEMLGDERKISLVFSALSDEDGEH